MKEDDWNEGTKEREILAAMVMRAPVLSRLASLAGEKGEWKMFVSPDANRIASWCIEHWRKYGKPPRKAIGSYMAAWVEQSQPMEEVQDMTSRLLTVCSEEYERKDDDWMIDRAGEHFRTVTARRLKDDIEALLETGDIDKAEERIARHSRIELGGSSMTDPFTDREDHKSIFAKESLDNLVDYPGAMGKFFRNTFHRGAFVAFCAPQKTYKSTFLVDLAWRAMVFHQRKVAYFEIGDFTEREIKEKFAVRNARHPSLTDDAWPMTVEVPTDISVADENEIATVRSEKRTFAAPLDFDTSWEACLKTMNEKVKSNTSRFRMATYGNLAISALGIKELLERLDRDGFVCDVCVIDYADQLAPVDKREETRDRVHTTWKHLRALALERHCLVVTATQVNAAGFKAKWLDRIHFSEDNRKLNLVSGLVGINANDEERRKGICRLKWIVKRRGHPAPPIWLAQCLPLGNPCVKSCFCEKTGRK